MDADIVNVDFQLFIILLYGKILSQEKGLAAYFTYAKIFTIWVHSLFIPLGSTSPQRNHASRKNTRSMFLKTINVNNLSASLALIVMLSLLSNSLT